MESFLAFRRGIKKPLKPASFPAWVRKHAALDDATLAATIENSIANGWQGLFPEQVTLPRPRREGASDPASEKKGGGGWAHPLAVPPCADWKAYAEAICERMNWDPAALPELNWSDLTAEERQAVRDEWQRQQKGGVAA